MLQNFIAIAVVIVGGTIWITSIKRKLLALDENISDAMSQIGVQLSSRFDTLMSILDLTNTYDKHESEMLIATVKSRRSVITSKSTPDDVMLQEWIISEAFGRIEIVAETHPELKAEHTYIKALDALQLFDNMVRTSRLIYNDSITKLNSEIRVFPVSMIANILGFCQREYLEE